jgi:hypothetical protein
MKRPEASWATPWEANMSYTPIINIVHILESTLYLTEHTDYPHKGHPAIAHVQSALRNAIAAIHELEPLQADAVEQQKTIVSR